MYEGYKVYIDELGYGAIIDDWFFDTEAEAVEFMRGFDLEGYCKKNNMIGGCLSVWPYDHEGEYEGDALFERAVKWDALNERYEKLW